MKTAIEQLRRGYSFDLKLQKQPVAALVLFVFILYLISILLGDKPRTVYYFSEMGMYPLVIMLMLLLFQREIGGGSMEMIATYPVSLRLIAVRKWVLALLYASLLNVGWMAVYLLKFGRISTFMYPWGGGEGAKRVTGIFPLMLQTMPAFMLLASITLIGMVIFRKTYGGLALGFAVWMVDTVSGGSWLSRWTLYTAFLPEKASFPLNRVMLMLAAAALLAAAVWLIGKRERWIIEEEE
ncbi:hypothetical protein KB559_19955 [Paenibacillus sp. Marseille-P2973]|uniref:hypothetical protein n=1 Tax=Paenibacillus TaxID=44249 RepID=UPI001B3615E9|nr:MULTISPECIES: hypothetical protein [Paenibacillus]MBQ4901120.1 hypothetical protein [Paenibacillus sp. Marseille-P2973]MDN4068147.1 hypothetical protein [Paenibacillus vini]